MINLTPFEERKLKDLLELSLDYEMARKIKWCEAFDFEQLKSFLLSSLREQREMIKKEVGELEELIPDRKWKNISTLGVWKEGIKQGRNQIRNKVLSLISDKKI